MPAYSSPVSTACDADRCTRLGTREVRTATNERCGRYCDRHAAELVDLLNSPAPRPEAEPPRWAQR